MPRSTVTAAKPKRPNPPPEQIAQNQDSPVSKRDCLYFSCELYQRTVTTTLARLTLSRLGSTNMNTPRRIILFGNSVFLAGVASSLRDDARLEIVCVDSVIPNAFEVLRAHAPAAIIYDRNNVTLSRNMPLLYECNSPVVIGIEADQDHALVFVSRQPSIHSMQDLKELILQM